MTHYRDLAKQVICERTHARLDFAQTPCTAVHKAPPGHTGRECLGNCDEHPLVVGDVGCMLILENAGFQGVFWRVAADDEEEVERLESADARAAREAKERDERVAAAEAANVARKAERWGMKFRVPKPCKYASFFVKRACVACQEAGIHSIVPEGQADCRAVIPAHTRKNHMGDTYQVAARVCGAPLSGCHNHETHTCIYVHPDEPQWADACSGRLDTRFDNRLVFCLATDPASMRNHSEVTPYRGGGGGFHRGGGGGGGFHRGGGGGGGFHRGGGGGGGGHQSGYPPRAHQSGYPPRTPSGSWRPQQPPPAPQPSRPETPAHSRFGTFEDSSSEEEGDRSAW